jgi:hypothetical protein
MTQFKRAKGGCCFSVVFTTMSVYHNTHWHIFYKDLSFSPRILVAVNFYMFDALR